METGKGARRAKDSPGLGFKSIGSDVTPFGGLGV